MMTRSLHGPRRAVPQSTEASTQGPRAALSFVPPLLLSLQLGLRAYQLNYLAHLAACYDFGDGFHPNSGYEAFPRVEGHHSRIT